MTNDANNGHTEGKDPALEPDFSQLPLEQQVAVLSESLAQAQEEAARNLETTQRAQAETANIRRRADEDRVANAKYSNTRLLTKLLPAIEDLQLAVAHAPVDSWTEGVKLVQRKFAGVLESEGLVPIKTDGEMFDPLEHEALGTEETTEFGPGYITQTVRPGYRLHDRVVRPAQVMVAREPQTKSDPTSTRLEGEEENNG